MYKEYLRKIMDNSNNISKDELYEMIDEYAELMENVMQKIKENHPDLYNQVEMTLYEMANGEELTDEMACKWVREMKPYAEHWSKEQIHEVLQRNNLDYDVIDFYVLMNMYYNDFYNTFKDDTATYIKITRDKLEDVDMVDNWLYKEFKMYMGD